MNRIVHTSFHEEVELEGGEQVRKDLAGPGDPRDPDLRDGGIQRLRRQKSSSP